MKRTDEPLKVLYIGRNGRLMEEVRKNEAMQIIQAENSLHAVTTLTNGLHPAAILCEYHLPGKNGLALFKHIHQEKGFHHVPFILLTEKLDENILVESFRQQADDYLTLNQLKANSLYERLQHIQEFKPLSKDPSLQSENEAVFHMPLTKRLFDIITASTALLLLSPILILVIIAIRLESKGKVYYTSKRVGRKVFDFYKLRSMRTGADSELKKLAAEKNQYNQGKETAKIDFSAPCPRCAQLPEGQTCSPVLFIDNHNICDHWYNEQKKMLATNQSAFVKIANDPRITRVGKFIRNTSIDELPQLINVIKGDMSIVGNRPLPVYEAELLTMDTLSKRFLAPAGITGLWQVELRGKGGQMSEDERKSLDNEYADHFKDGKYSFWYDIKLILRTIPAMFQKSTV